MEQPKPLILESAHLQSPQKKRELLPWWIRVFLWIFLVLGAVVPLVLLAGLTGRSTELSLYGLETGSPFSATGMTISVLFLLKAVVAWGLWTGRTWAVRWGIADAVLGIGICLSLMAGNSFLSDTGGFRFSLRPELLLLVPYLIKLIRIRPAWEGKQRNR